VVALRGLQSADGTWPYGNQPGAEIGATALAGLTLLECGAADDDVAVRAAAEVVRKASVNVTLNYSIALSILFFDRLSNPADIPLTESLTVRLLAGQTASGGWSYNCPPVSAAETQRLQKHLVEHKELPSRRELPKPGALKRTANGLPKEIQEQLAALKPMEHPSGGDNSNTQFAALALWVGRRYGIPVNEALKRIETRFRTSQNGDGGWAYISGVNSSPPGDSTASMTCAGLLGLAIANGEAIESVQEKRPGFKPARDISNDPCVRAGLIALGRVIRQPRGGGELKDCYFYWSLERVAVALDLTTIGQRDWYTWGTESLLADQQPDGTWKGKYPSGGADTCFALLFLKRSNFTPDLTALLNADFRGPYFTLNRVPPG
jgi:hypothetical protein